VVYARLPLVLLQTTRFVFLLLIFGPGHIYACECVLFLFTCLSGGDANPQVEPLNTHTYNLSLDSVLLRSYLIKSSRATALIALTIKTRLLALRLNSLAVCSCLTILMPNTLPDLSARLLVDSYGL
jgi:hypothetical protein